MNKILCAEKKNAWETRHFPRRWEKRKKIRKRSTEKKKISSTVKVRSKPGPVDFICMTF